MEKCLKHKNRNGKRKENVFCTFAIDEICNIKLSEFLYKLLVVLKKTIKIIDENA